MPEPMLALRDQAIARGVPCGMLAWWGRTDFPDGSANAPQLSQADWESWYMRLQQAALDCGAVAPLFRVKAMTAPLRPDGPLPVAIANFRVALPSRPLEEKRAFFACGLLHDQWATATPAYRGRDVTYRFDARFYFTNPCDPPPDTIDIDPGDGRGYRTLRFGDYLTAHYASGDQATATVRCGNLLSSFAVPLGDQPAAPVPDETWGLRGANGNAGTAYVYRALHQPRLSHPLIVAEGFPGGYPCDYLYEMVNQHGLLEDLRAAGYDVILLAFANGMDLIQNNAPVAEACIRQAMQCTSNPLVVSGVSMGGLVTRYALADMEARRVPHNTRIFLTIDTPHRGAYTSLCDQWFAHYFATSSPLAAMLAMLLDSPANQQFVMTWVHGDSAQPSPLRQRFLQALDAIGGYPKLPRKLAISSGSGGGERSLPPLELALDWSGSEYASARLWTAPEDGATAHVVGEGHSLLADGSMPDRCRVASDVSWEGAPGGQNIYNFDSAAIAAGIGYGTVRDPIPRSCSVPTVSALDLSVAPFVPVPPPGSGASPFDDYTCCECNQLHVQFTPKVKRWLLDQLNR
jgi:hypothetical protein